MFCLINDFAAKSTICLKDHPSIVARMHLSPYMGYPPCERKGFRSRIINSPVNDHSDYLIIPIILLGNSQDVSFIQ